MDSRLLTKLSVEAGRATDPVVWAKALCRAASHFAAHGRTEEALTAIAVVRGQFGRDLHFDIASWLMLAEGVLHYFEARVPESYDRIRRAYGLAIALRNTSAFPSCAAWMAAIEYELADYDSMFKHLTETFEHASPTDYQAKARASLTTGMLFHLADDFDGARPWYERARMNATSEGDNASVSASFYDMVISKAYTLRLKDSFGEDVRTEAAKLRIEALSSHHYDTAIGTQGLSFLNVMLRALVFTLERNYTNGFELYQQLDPNVLTKRLRPIALVDLAWCKANLDMLENYDQAVCEILAGENAVVDDDDRAYLNARITQIATHFGNTALAETHRKHAFEALTRHRAFQQEILSRVTLIKYDDPKRKNPA